jgi:hypothetical protein
MTAKEIVVNLDRTFSPGQAYVAMSRVTSKKGLFIETDNEIALQKKIYADMDIKLALSCMERYFVDGNKDCGEDTENYITFLLLNVQSLRAHFQEVISDDRFTRGEVVCLTETWLKDSENVQEIEIPDFHLHHITRKQCYDNSSDLFTKMQAARGGGIGVYKKKMNKEIIINALDCKNIEGISIEICDDETMIIILYRPSVLPVEIFLKRLQTVMDLYTKRFPNIIIAGDLNEDTKVKGPIQSFCESIGLVQIVDFHTTEGGTTLDHVYVKDPQKVSVRKVPVYFSYHEAVEIRLEKK